MALKAPKNWILIRGLARSEFHWKNFAVEMKAALGCDSVRTVELPGNGRLYNERTPSDIQAVLQEFRQQAEISGAEPAGLLGVSLGGVLATAWAQSYPAEVSHLVIINSSSPQNPFYDRLFPRHYRKILKMLIFPKAARSEKFILSVTSNNRNKWEPQVSDNIAYLKKYPVSAANFLRQLKLASQVDFLNIPEAAKLILASRHDRLVSSRCSEVIADIWDMPLEFHESAGHDLPLDDAEWIFEKIKGFTS